MLPHYGKRRPTNGWDRFGCLGHPYEFQRVSWQHYCTVLQQWASAKLGGMEQRAPPVFGRATITLGIGPHSSFKLIFVRFLNISHFIFFMNVMTLKLTMVFCFVYRPIFTYTSCFWCTQQLATTFWHIGWHDRSWTISISNLSLLLTVTSNNVISPSRCIFNEIVRIKFHSCTAVAIKQHLQYSFI